MTLTDALIATWPRDPETGLICAGTELATFAPKDDATLAALEQQMRDHGQAPRFLIGPEDAQLDQRLAAAGYLSADPATLFAAPASAVATERPPAISAFDVWAPLRIIDELWADEGLDPRQRAGMDHLPAPKTAVLGRVNDRVAGAAFAIIHGNTAIIQAFGVVPSQRRQRTAINMMRHAAFWALDHGADTVAALVPAHTPEAQSLCASLGMRDVGHYHYRICMPNEAQAVD